MTSLSDNDAIMQMSEILKNMENTVYEQKQNIL